MDEKAPFVMPPKRFSTGLRLLVSTMMLGSSTGKGMQTGDAAMAYQADCALPVFVYFCRHCNHFFFLLRYAPRKEVVFSSAVSKRNIVFVTGVDMHRQITLIPVVSW